MFFFTVIKIQRRIKVLFFIIFRQIYYKFCFIVQLQTETFLAFYKIVYHIASLYSKRFLPHWPVVFRRSPKIRCLSFPARKGFRFCFLLYHTFGLKTRPEQKIFTLPLFTLLPRAGYTLVVCLFVGFRLFIKDGFSACRWDRNMGRASGRAGNVSPSVPGHGTTLSLHCGTTVPRVYMPVRPSLRHTQARERMKK